MSEPLYACPLCGRHGFTRRGIQTHCCRALPKTTIEGVISRDAFQTGSITTRHQRLPAEIVQGVLMGHGKVIAAMNQPTDS